LRFLIKSGEKNGVEAKVWSKNQNISPKNSPPGRWGVGLGEYDQKITHTYCWPAHNSNNAPSPMAALQCKTVRCVWCTNPSTEIDLRHCQTTAFGSTEIVGVRDGNGLIRGLRLQLQLRLLAIFGSSYSVNPLHPTLLALAIYLQIFFNIKNMFSFCLTLVLFCFLYPVFETYMGILDL